MMDRWKEEICGYTSTVWPTTIFVWTERFCGSVSEYFTRPFHLFGLFTLFTFSEEFKSLSFSLRNFCYSFFNFYTVNFCSVFTNNQQCTFDSLLLHSTASAGFEARATSSGSFCVPAELHSKYVQIYGIQ
jgi:hypothetical protein